ncbi:unnamed protein product, partial [Ectocarpus sp. 4 AP-2014]
TPPLEDAHFSSAEAKHVVPPLPCINAALSVGDLRLFLSRPLTATEKDSQPGKKPRKRRKGVRSRAAHTRSSHPGVLRSAEHTGATAVAATAATVSMGIARLVIDALILVFASAYALVSLGYVATMWHLRKNFFIVLRAITDPCTPC